MNRNSIRFLQPGQRLRWSRFLAVCQKCGAMTVMEATWRYRQLRAQRSVKRRSFRVVSDDASLARYRNRLPARLRLRCVIVDSIID